MYVMNILITAGGNTEKIDEVREIRNTGTGRLGALIAEKLSSAPEAPRIFYICDRHAATPSAGDVTVIHANDVTALGEAVRTVCAEHRIDAVVHSMAVSDYRVKNVTTALKAAEAAAGYLRETIFRDGYSKGRCDGILDDLWSLLKKPKPRDVGWLERHKLADSIADAPNIREGGKMSSDLDDVLVILERAPKIIALFRELAPDAVVVGFKLLTDVDEEELIRVGHELLKKNDCDYVLANDMKYLRKGGHVGHLVARDGSYQTYDGKEAIAAAIAEAVCQNVP
jgi:phosphopantothenate-cysteine ligase